MKKLLSVLLCFACVSNVVSAAHKNTPKPYFWNLTPDEFMEINPWGSMDRDYWYHWYTKHPKQKPADYDMAPGFGINPGAKEFIKNNPDIPEKIKQKMLKKSKRKHHRAKKKHHRRTKHKKRRNGKKDTAKARNSEDQALGDLKVLMECSDYVKINPEAYKLPAGIYDEEF